MDPRGLAGLAVSDALRRLNRRHPWSHNDHFHGWILSNLPAQRARALDVGCGQGELAARLAERFEEVVADDVDAGMRDAAARRCAGLPNVTVTGAPLSELAGPFDVVTMVAVLHHLQPAAALARVADLLAPGGRFLCVGLARPESPLDVAAWAASVVTNPLIGVVKHPWPNREAATADPYPVKDPDVTVAELRAALRRTMPGATLRRRLGFRHTISWEKPARVASARVSRGPGPLR